MKVNEPIKPLSANIRDRLKIPITNNTMQNEGP